jgi:hypothetical protein
MSQKENAGGGGEGGCHARLSSPTLTSSELSAQPHTRTLSEAIEPRTWSLREDTALREPHALAGAGNTRGLSEHTRGLRLREGLEAQAGGLSESGDECCLWRNSTNSSSDRQGGPRAWGISVGAGGGEGGGGEGGGEREGGGEGGGGGVGGGHCSTSASTSGPRVRRMAIVATELCRERITGGLPHTLVA